jgi:hypothetical protein
MFTRQQLAELFESCGLETVFSARSYPSRFSSSNKMILAGRKPSTTAST